MQHSFPILLHMPPYMETKVFNKTLNWTLCFGKAKKIQREFLFFGIGCTINEWSTPLVLEIHLSTSWKTKGETAIHETQQNLYQRNKGKEWEAFSEGCSNSIYSLIVLSNSHAVNVTIQSMRKETPASGKGHKW